MLLTLETMVDKLFSAESDTTILSRNKNRLAMLAI